MAKRIIGNDSFLEIYIAASVSVCEKRDPKGLYRMALSGKIKNLTGISSPYEAPPAPDIKLNTADLSVEKCVSILQNAIAAKIK